MTTAKKTTTKTQDPVGLEFWDTVCETDPAITKRVTQKGGFTAIDAQVQVKNATALWGPYGGAWGVKDCKYGKVGLNAESGGPLEITLDAVFYSPLGEMELSTDIAFRVGGDSRKKLLTDLTTKALSKLGFNSDVFEGKFDDNKYVAEMRLKYSQPPKPDADKAYAEAVTKARADGCAVLENIGHSPEDALSDMEDRMKLILQHIEGGPYVSYLEIKQSAPRRQFHKSLVETVEAMERELDEEAA
jgi:hypothetical protein